VQLWILIDDGLESGFGVQIADLRNFVAQQGPNVKVGIGYMRNGTVSPTEQPTTDHEAAAKSIRLPLGAPAVSASPYMSLTELLNKHPAAGEQVREVLMITSGVDPYYGAGPDNPYLAHAIDQAVRAGVVVHSIYYGAAGHFGHSYWQITWGQNYLS